MENKVYMELQCTFHGSVLANQGHKAFFYIYIFIYIYLYIYIYIYECWEGFGARGEGDDRGWDGWMASLTRWMWVWVNSGSWWWTGRPGVLQFIGSQRVGHNWATELIWSDLIYIYISQTYVGPTPKPMRNIVCISVLGNLKFQNK